MTRKLVLGLSLAVALGTAGCKDQRTDLMAPSGETGSQSTALGGVRLERGRIKLPSSARLTDQHFADAARRAIDPDDYVCDPSSPVIDWFIGEVDRVVEQEPEIFDLLYNQLLADLIPTYDALLFQTTATPQYFGYSGEYTRIMLKTERDVKRFWNIFSADIQLIGMHGTMLLDEQRVAATYESFIFGVPPAVAAFFASLIHEAMLESQTLNGGNHPLFSFNAFALSAPELSLPDKIVMGDGILAGYAAVGYSDVAPQAIYAHEFGHHIQFENGYFEDPIVTDPATDDAEDTRYTELMADAFSAYYLTHKRGAGMKRQRVEQFLQVFFQIGDCAFDNPGHHGTPNQRMAAARFGFSVADEAQKNGHILTSQQFHARFVAAYPQLVAPDA